MEQDLEDAVQGAGPVSTDATALFNRNFKTADQWKVQLDFRIHILGKF